MEKQAFSRLFQKCRRAIGTFWHSPLRQIYPAKKIPSRMGLGTDENLSS